MESNRQPNRRHFLKMGAGTAGILALAAPLSKAFAAACGLTPEQTSGPFYPGETSFHSENDLTSVDGIHRAAGQVIYIRGKILDTDCLPVAGATVEIWQACASGRYNNPNDINPAPLDPHFKYWGEAHTDESGTYTFKSIIPGAYPADTNWMRPPHVHVKVSKLRFKELITQMYFKGNPLNDADLILREVPQNERDSVIVDFTPGGNQLEIGSLIGTFDMTIQKIR